MFEGMTEQEAREEILSLVRAYCGKYHNRTADTFDPETAEYHRIPYAGRVYDAEEMTNLVDSSLEFWLTAGRYTDEFESKRRDFRFLGEPGRLLGAYVAPA